MKMKVFAGALFTLVIPLFVFVGAANAQEFRGGQSPTVSSDETIDGSAYIAGASVDVSGTINGDLYCAGQSITISGTVNGDILCAGQTISFSGTTNGNVRMTGQTIAVNGTMAKSASLAGQTITIDRQGKIGQDATVLGQSVHINGLVARDLVLSSVTATINSQVGRNVKADIETLSLTKSALIGGTVDYSSPNKFIKADGSEIAGKVTYTPVKYESNKPTRGFDLVGLLVWSLMLIVSAVIFALLFPQLLHTVTAPMTRSVSQTLLVILIGFVATIVMPVAIVIMMITIVGIPFAFVTLIAWILVLALSGVFSAYYTGRVIWKSQNNALLTMLVGAIALVILLAIPIINVLAGLVSLWLGSGAVIMHLRSLYVAPNYDTAHLKTKRTKA